MFDDDVVSMPTEIVTAELLSPGGGAALELESALASLVAKVQANLARLLRYGATSLVCLAISEATLLVLVEVRVNAALAAVAANLAGTLPSYLLSRYWIWREADRARVGRQVFLYWSTSLAAILVTSVATDAVARHAPIGSLHLPFIGLGYLAISIVLWVTKFALYEKVIFPGSDLEEPATAH
ncbi:MAG TPA: GtrA family protein [Acidimicrobiales bacterium]|nr:GtrA family protein [Acidimicrobiales bacterium]